MKWGLGFSLDFGFDLAVALSIGAVAAFSLWFGSWLCKFEISEALLSQYKEAVSL